MDYDTVWVEYVELEKKLSSLGIPPNPSVAPFNPKYYSPALQLPDGANFMGTLECAAALDKLQPEPSLRLDNGYVEKASQAAMAVVLGNIGDSFPAFAAKCLTPRDREYFERTRSEWMGVGSFAELAKDPLRTGEKGWVACQEGLKACAELLAEHPDGPFVEGKQFSYADCIFGSLWMTYKRVDEALFAKILAYDERLQKHYDACEPYLKRSRD